MRLHDRRDRPSLGEDRRVGRHPGACISQTVELTCDKSGSGQGECRTTVERHHDGRGHVADDSTARIVERAETDGLLVVTDPKRTLSRWPPASTGRSRVRARFAAAIAPGRRRGGDELVIAGNASMSARGDVPESSASTGCYGAPARRCRGERPIPRGQLERDQKRLTCVSVPLLPRSRDSAVAPLTTRFIEGAGCVRAQPMRLALQSCWRRLSLERC